ncbi:MAG: nitrilase [Prolixibacteraceae bacterium]|jgi:5-aminopentanamidase|nr:nitrilase [Prolixibacteraceae bacterium]MBT6005371.1 nitrilase [Prolixibacteraceae bacterium]MBT6767145.1 nitrilase [Prolixibacteraceae bacterium]MBT6999730.1 nitrilase [Prolixibacteraceae bacterium]MBT7394686.1 nitrilase [Prolixibacteraceae bacterium]
MKNINIAVAQFEPKDGDKDYNLSIIEELTQKAKKKGADVISFHELSITAYTFLKNLDREQIFELAEEIPNDKSCRKLISISKKYDIPILAGIVERQNDKIFNTYFCVDSFGLIASYRKLHPFINPHLSAGNNYVVFDLKGWKCGILICYDNNIVENVRATSLLGADVIFAPHVTGCTPSSMPGRGFVDDAFWQKRNDDPVPLRLEFDGPKGRGWLMRWLPARAFDNGVYYIFTNPIGYDGEHLKNGNSMILDPYGELLTEIKSFDNEITIGTLTADKLKLSGGFRYKNARRPELYRDIIGKENNSETKPVWLNKK